MAQAHLNDLRGRDAYLLLHCDTQSVAHELAFVAVKEVEKTYTRLIHERGWRLEHLDASVSWMPHGIVRAFWVRGWEAYGVLSEEPERHCAAYPRPRGKGSTVDVCVQAYVAPEAAEYEWGPFLREVREWNYYSFGSTGPRQDVPAAIRLYHDPTGNFVECWEATRASTLKAGHYARECNRKAAWSFLLHRFRAIGYASARRAS